MVPTSTGENVPVETPAVPKRSGSSRLPGLAGLRAFSVLAVIVSHLSFSPQLPQGRPLLARILSEGQNGVEVFFVISGFLITWLLLAEERKFGAISLRNFYLRRVIRILPPAYLFLLGLVALRYAGFASPWGDLLRAAFFMRNLSDQGSATSMHFWSLAIEEQFYLIWPLLFLLAGRKRRFGIVVLGIVFVPVWRYLHAAHWFGYDGFNPRRFDFACDAILFGVALALSRDSNGGRRFLQAPLLQNQWTILAGVACIFGVILLPFHSHPAGEAILPPIKAIVAAMCINYLVEGRGGPLDWIANARPMVWIGTLSYSLYLWQQPFCRDYAHRTLLNSIPLNLGLSLLLAMGSFYLLEKPLARYRAKLERGKRTADVTAVAPIEQRPGKLAAV